MSENPKSRYRHGTLLLDLLLAFLAAAILIRPLFKAKYLQLWSSIESTFIADGRFLAAHGPHPLWQPLWYCGTRFDYVYPPVLRYGTAILSSIFIPVKAYHVFTAVLFCSGIAAVFFMVRIMGASRLQAWLSALAALLISPSFLFLPQIRHDSPYWMPWRLGVLVRYGEGPHISSLSLLPFALGFAFLGLRQRRLGSIALASLFSALVVLTNFYGATSLAILYPILVWSVWVAFREPGLLKRALAIPALAYALSAFWLTPAYLRITLYNLRYVSQPGNQYSYILTIVALLIFGAASIKWASRKPQLVYLVFVSGSLLFMALNVLGHFYFNFRVLGEPGRLIPELDMAIMLWGIEVLRRLWLQPFENPLHLRLAQALVILMALCSAWPAVRYLPHAWEMYPKEPDYQSRVEYRISSWIAAHMPDSRTYVTGSTRFWWDAWYDNAEVGGGSDQGLMNPNPSIAAWENVIGTDPDLSIRWLQALGADAVIVADKHSQDEYRDFTLPYKFAGILPVLFDDHQGNVIYRIPRRYASLARVLDRNQLYSFKPIDRETYHAQLIAYSDFVEHGPDVPTTTHWNGTDSISVHSAPLQEGQSVLVQVTWDPAWRAYTGKTELPIRADGMDFIAVDAPPGTQDIVLVFEKPVGNRIGYAVTSLALLLCLCLGFVSIKSAPLPAIEPAPFDPERFRQSREALPGNNPSAEALALVPPPKDTGRVLELGCRMEITPFLQSTCGYKEVRGAASGPAGKIEQKSVEAGGEKFSCYIDYFNPERDEFPYPDRYFDLVIAQEIIESFTGDPQPMLVEVHRILTPGGSLLISARNAASTRKVVQILEASPGTHLREYTIQEFGETIRTTGFEIQSLFTSAPEEFSQNKDLSTFFARHHYSTENRGQRIWCLARKPAAA
jgi:SAM-dependent methyltransferase